MNKQAELINKKLDINLFNTEIDDYLVLNKFTKKQILKEHIDDLIDVETKQGTDRLNRLVREILKEYKQNKGV